MGYRSEVAYVIEFKDREHRIRFMATASLDPDIKLEEFELLDDTSVMFYRQDIKWYPEYDYVKAHELLLNTAKEQGCEWEFCRVGEDMDDNIHESSDNSSGELGVTRSIFTPCHGEFYPVGESLTKEDN